MSINENIGKAMKGATDGLIKRTTKRYRNLVREVAYAIVDGTPVDKGRLINNWYPTVNKPSSKVTTKTDRSGNRSKVRVNNLLARIKLKNNFYFTNNTPYAQIVEYGGYPNPPKNPTGKTVNGFSKQAPRRMLRVNLQKGLARARNLR